MFDFLKRLMGGSPAITQAVPDLPTEPREGRTSVGDAAIDRYFELSRLIERAKADGDFLGAVRAARETYPLMPTVVREMKRQYGRFDISTSHAVHTAGTLMAVTGDREGIQELRRTLLATPELNNWLPIADNAEVDASLVEAIVDAVGAQPGLKQRDLKRCISGEGPRLGTLAAWLEKARRLQRVSQGSTYLLYPANFPIDQPTSDSPSASDAGTIPSTTAITVPVHWRARSRTAQRARALSLQKLTYVRLPKAPMAWDARYRAQREPISDVQSDAGADSSRTSTEMPRGALAHFILEGAGWELIEETALLPKERPNPAYRDMFHTTGSTVWIDPHGRREGFPTASAVALTMNRAGAKIAERALRYDVYRTDVNADGSGMIFLSRDGILHSYNTALEPCFLEAVGDIPEYAAQARRFGIDPHALKNHVRCVALSTDRTRSLITVADEAWCYDTASGQPVWGLRFPLKEGWTEVAAKRSDVVGASREVDAALHLMELTLPITPQEITRQYRSLAMRWHPDRNPHNSEATRKFQDLSAAMELLTGVDLSRLSSSETERVTYQQILHQSSIAVADGLTVTFSVAMQTGGAFAVDWIYAANFAHSGHTTFLAGYSGAVVEVSAEGLPVRVYDIGAVPRHVADTPLHRYILTDTRLYVLCQDRLEALVDVFDQGRLVVGDHGFGLLQTKQFQWFTPAGQLLGKVRTRDPIRRIYSGPKGLVLETRMRRGVISGAPAWWTV